MPRYFFDVHDHGGFHRDDEGTECVDLEKARQEARHALPEIARFAIPSDGDQQAFTVLVRLEGSEAVVYTATLTYAGLTLNGEAGA